MTRLVLSPGSLLLSSFLLFRLFRSDGLRGLVERKEWRETPNESKKHLTAETQRILVQGFYLFTGLNIRHILLGGGGVQGQGKGCG